jgi:RNA polymerase-binding transcription factor DksA
MATTKKKGKDLTPVKEKLSTERDGLLGQIAEIEARYSGEETIETGTGGEGEPETVTVDRERDLSLLENSRDLLDQVERALRKVADGTYGKCANCGKSIEAARLKALPHASLCISCKRLEERR